MKVRCIDPECWADPDDIIEGRMNDGTIIRRCLACGAEWTP